MSYPQVTISSIILGRTPNITLKSKINVYVESGNTKNQNQNPNGTVKTYRFEKPLSVTEFEHSIPINWEISTEF